MRRYCERVRHPSAKRIRQIRKKTAYKTKNFVVEPALRVQMVEERAVRRTPPKLHISDFEIAPNWVIFSMTVEDRGR